LLYSCFALTWQFQHPVRGVLTLTTILTKFYLTSFTFSYINLTFYRTTFSSEFFVMYIFGICLFLFDLTPGSVSYAKLRNILRKDVIHSTLTSNLCFVLVGKSKFAHKIEVTMRASFDFIAKMISFSFSFDRFRFRLRS
jgi:hypothetical protein